MAAIMNPFIMSLMSKACLIRVVERCSCLSGFEIVYTKDNRGETTSCSRRILCGLLRILAQIYSHYLQMRNVFNDFVDKFWYVLMFTLIVSIYKQIIHYKMQDQSNEHRNLYNLLITRVSYYFLFNMFNF